MSDYDDNPDLSDGAMAYLNGNARKQRLHEEESARRLARYDEAIALLRDYETVFGCTEDAAFAGKVRAFLAAEPAERGEGGAG